MGRPSVTVTRVAQLAGLGCVLLLCAAPVVAMFFPLITHPGESVAELGNLLGSGRLWGLWAKTCGIAIGTAVLALLMGAPLGLLLDQPAFRGRAWLRILLSTPLLLPAHVLAVAWVDILGQQGILNDIAAVLGLPPHVFPLYSSVGVIMIQGLSLYPIPLWTIWNAARTLDPSIAEAARNLGAKRSARLRLMFPLLAPAAATGVLIVFLFSLLGLSVASLLQVSVFSVEIFTRFNSFADQREAALLALPLCLTGLGVLAAAAWCHGRGRRQGNVHDRRPLAGACNPVGGWVAIALATGTGTLLPVAALAWRSLPPSTLVSAWHTGIQEIGTSVLLAAVSATLLVALTLPLAWRKGRLTRVVLWPAALAWLVSGPVFGVGLIQVWNHPGPAGWLYDGFGILLVAVMGRNLLFAWLGCRLALEWLPADADEAARNLGATPWHRFWVVLLPSLRLPLLAVWGGLALLAMGEVECTVLVAPPGWVPVSLRIFTLMHYGPASMVSALALLQALVTAALLISAALLTRRRKVYTP